MDEWFDLMTLRPLCPGQIEREELRLSTVKAEDVDAMTEFWTPLVSELWVRPSARQSA